MKRSEKIQQLRQMEAVLRQYLTRNIAGPINITTEEDCLLIDEWVYLHPPTVEEENWLISLMSVIPATHEEPEDVDYIEHRTLPEKQACIEVCKILFNRRIGEECEQALEWSSD